MMIQITAASLVAESRTLCMPASVQSIPTDANQEDFVPMGMAAAFKARRRPVVSGEEQMIGSIGVMMDDAEREGWARVHSEQWQVRSAVPVRRGQPVRILRMDGLVLEVAPMNEGA